MWRSSCIGHAQVATTGSHVHALIVREEHVTIGADARVVAPSVDARSNPAYVRRLAFVNVNAGLPRFVQLKPRRTRANVTSEGVLALATIADAR